MDEALPLLTAPELAQLARQLRVIVPNGSSTKVRCSHALDGTRAPALTRTLYACRRPGAHQANVEAAILAHLRRQRVLVSSPRKGTLQRVLSMLGTGRRLHR